MYRIGKCPITILPSLEFREDPFRIDEFSTGNLDILNQI
jgi:hypothetical protein